MPKNHAVVVGINKYDNLQSLKYAKRDAKLVSDLLHSILFDQVYLFSDDSPAIPRGDGSHLSSQPSYGNLMRFLKARFEKPFLSTGDNLWFFFSGHGLRFMDRDFLIPCDGDPGGLENTAFPVRYVAERLRRSGADNVILFIDACRNTGSKSVSSFVGEKVPGLVIFFSCSPNELSYEIDDIQQGSFAYALLEGLQGGTTSTVKKLDQYLRLRVPQINLRFKKPLQTPYVSVEPLGKVDLIILPESATIEDIQTLKIDALEAESNKDYETARKLWIRVLSVSPADPEAIKAIEEFSQKTAEAQSIYTTPEKNEFKPTEEKNFSRVGNLLGAENDLVSERDQLGFKDYVQAFVDLIESPATHPPLTIGIFGSWGIGKSFLLHHICKEIRRRYEIRLKTKLTDYEIPRTYIVEFNAWEYSAAQVIWPCLVRRIMNCLEPQVSWGFPGYFMIKFSRNLKRQIESLKAQLIVVFAIIIGLIVFSFWKFDLDISLIWSASIALGIGGISKLVADTMSKPLSQWVTTIFQSNDYGKKIDFMEEIRADLGLLARRLKKNGGRILIIIDDLDRCEPQKAVEVLQAIKLLLDFDTFIVCLGIDARIVTRAIEKHYSEILGPAGTSGYEYLDKIVQIPFRIPEPTLDEIKVFIGQQLGDPKPSNSGIFKPFEEPQNPFEQSSIESEETVITEELETKVYESELLISFTYEELKVFHDIARYLRPNPRHLKRLVNVYRLVRSLAKYKNESLILNQPDIIVCWLVMSGQWPYTTYAMLYYFEEMQERQEEGKLLEFPKVEPLTYLFEKVNLQITEDQDALVKQQALDFDTDILRMLIQSYEGRFSWKSLNLIRNYTINFNPAVGVDLKTELPIRFIESE